MKKLTPDPPALIDDTSPRRYMALTSNDCTIPALLIDTEAPLDVLHEAAAYRIRAAASCWKTSPATPTCTAIRRCSRISPSSASSPCATVATCWTYSAGACRNNC